MQSKNKIRLTKGKSSVKSKSMKKMLKISRNLKDRSKKRAVKTVKSKKVKKSKKNKIKISVELLDRKISKNRKQNLIKRVEIVTFIKNIAGEEGYLVFEALVDVGKIIDEYALAERVKLQINFVRSLLYKLYDHKLVSFNRERDKKKGWFIYSWLAHPEKLKYILINHKREQIDKLKALMNVKEENFYCPACEKTCEYAKAIETMFFCEVCGGHLEAINSAKVKTKLTIEMDALNKEIDDIKKI